MYQQFNRYRILQVFFDNPNKKYQLREISRITNISLPSVKKHIEQLLKQNLIQEDTQGIYKGYKAKYSQEFKTLKKNDLIIRLEKSGLIEKIEKTCTPNCIILYGSAVEGKDDLRGDIDIFVQSTKKKIELKNYEKKIKRTISIIFEKNIKKIDNNFKNTIANGIVLRGFLKVI
jgi:predicted nucleotidyltransferase